MTIEFPQPFPRHDAKVESFIETHILVDTYGEDEVTMAWYAYLEDMLPFPFSGMIWTENRGNTSCFSQVTLEELAPPERCGHHQMWAMGRLSGQKKARLHFFLADLKSVFTPEAYQPIYHWKYWLQT